MTFGDGFHDLQELRDWILRHLEEGVHCPACGQWAKKYTRNLTGMKVVWLIWLVAYENRTGLPWVDLREGAATADRSKWGIDDRGLGGEHGKLAYWSLIEQRPNDNAKTKTSATWRSTTAGKAFVCGALKVPKSAVVYNGNPLAFSDQLVTIDECLGKNFDYGDLMSRGGLEITKPLRYEEAELTPLQKIRRKLKS